MSLPLTDGYYRLTERTEPSGYRLMSDTIVFSVTDGVISLLNAEECSDYAAELRQSVTQGDQTVNKAIGLELYNYVKVPVSIWKTDFDNHAITTGATFVLYKADNYDDDAQTPIEEDQIVISGTTGTNGLLSLGELDLGEYRLVETDAPAGYLKPEHAIKIFVRINGITAMQEMGNSDVNHKGDENWVTGQEENTAQIRIWNNPGVSLPSTGGPGTRIFTILGSILILGAGILLWRRRRLI
jgi:LPXTG-motif cell wall-anchored protein